MFASLPTIDITQEIIMDISPRNLPLKSPSPRPRHPEEHHEGRHREVEVGRAHPWRGHRDVVPQARGLVHAVTGLDPFHVAVDLRTLHVLTGDHSDFMGIYSEFIGICKDFIGCL